MDSELKEFSKKIKLYDNVMARSILNLYQDPIIIMSLVPYLSLICDSFYSYTDAKKKYKDVFSEITEIRNSIKFESQKYRKLKKRVIEVDNISHEKFAGKLKLKGCPVFPYNNFAIYTNGDKKIISTTNLVWFAEGNYTSKSDKEYFYSLGKDMGAFLTIMFQAITPDESPLFPLPKSDVAFYGAQFNTFTSKQFKNNYDRDINITLLNLLGLINFPRYVLKEIIGDNNFFYFKCRFISSYYAFTTLENMYNYSIFNRALTNENMQYLKELLRKYNIKIFSKLRSCLMHYDLSIEENIDYDLLNIKFNDFGLIKSLGYSTNYSNLISLLNEFCDRIEIFSKSIIDVSTSKLILLS